MQQIQFPDAFSAFQKPGKRICRDGMFIRNESGSRKIGPFVTGAQV